MTVAVNKTPGVASRLVNGVLSIKPLANLAKHQAREMMMKRAEKIGVHWRQEVQALLSGIGRQNCSASKIPILFTRNII
jgi:hypothetical protein